MVILLFLFTCLPQHLQNDFNFEMRDWMSVQRKELPEGSQLVRVGQLDG